MVPGLHVLTFNFHEPYLCLLAKTGYRFTVGQYTSAPLAREWQLRFRPVPANVELVPESQWRRELESGAYDVVIAHNEMNAADLLGCKTPCLLVCHNRRTFLETTITGDREAGLRRYRELLERLREQFQFIFISESKQADYGIQGRVIRPGIDVEEYGGYSGHMPEVLRVGNMMRARDLMFDVAFQERVCRGFPNTVVGEDPTIPHARPSASYSDLLETYRSRRCLLHVTREEYEDGYNLSTLEAMACGMPVVALANKTSPFTDGVDGLVSGEAAVLRKRIEELLFDRERAATIGARGRATAAREFPIGAFIEKWRDAIETAAEHRPRRPREQRAKSGADFPRLDILMEYFANPITTARYVEEALREDHNVATIGGVLPDEILREWGFEGSPPVCRRPNYERWIGDPVRPLVLAAAAGMQPAFYFWVDCGVDALPPDIESVPYPRVCYLIDTHCAFEMRAAYAQKFHFTFVAQRAHISRLIETGVPNVAWLPLACCPALHQVPPRERLLDVAFVGSVPEDNRDDRRTRLINRIRERFPNSRIGRAWPEEMARTYAAAKIVLNISAACDLNMRVFEGMASGALLITDEADGLEELFQDRKHLVIYRSDDELIPLIEKYLADEGERGRIARAGQQCVLEHHTYRARMRHMTLLLTEELGMLGGTSGETRFSMGGYYRSPRPELAAHVPKYVERVLDCGCGGGEFGFGLKRRGAKEVVGVELVERAWSFARDRLDNAILGNIEEIELPYADGHFDCVVFGDVLEHLVDPAATLRKVARVLATDGVIVMSIPNARFWQTIQMLANGRWKYEDAGIMDRTHLRFFCAPDMAQMVIDAGLEVIKLQPLSVYPAEQLVRDARGCIRLGKVTIGPLDDVEYRDFLTYQYLVVAAKPGMDRLIWAKRAIDAGDYPAAFEAARDAAGAPEAERRRLMGKAMAEMGKVREAVALYREALRLDPGDASTAEQLGLLLIAQDRPDEAEPLLRQALAATPANTRAQGALGLIHYVHGDFAAAAECFLPVLADDWHNEALVLRLIDCAMHLKRPALAEAQARRFVEFYPGNGEVSVAYARLLLALGRPGEARHALETALVLNPDFAPAAELLAALQGSRRAASM
jgi:spore maturation protein CgeB/2-polyprenyl-3-methyl-5-hydroxy-6-metoxy-1,4-benzoquinol methylase/Flp pilus assembly protein TadD